MTMISNIVEELGMVIKGSAKRLEDLENGRSIRNCTDYMKMTMISNVVEDLEIVVKGLAENLKNSRREKE